MRGLLTLAVWGALFLTGSQAGADTFNCTKTVVWTQGAQKGQRVNGVPCAGQVVMALNAESAAAAMMKNQCGVTGGKVEQLLVFPVVTPARTIPVNCPAH